MRCLARLIILLVVFSPAETFRSFGIVPPVSHRPTCPVLRTLLGAVATPGQRDLPGRVTGSGPSAQFMATNSDRHPGTMCKTAANSASVHGMKRLCVDIDNVIALTDQAIRTVIREVTDGRVNLSYSDIVHYNYWECRDQRGQGISRAEWDAVHDRVSKAAYIDSIAPAAGAVESLEELSVDWEIHYATARLRPAWKPTLEWLERHGFPEGGVHFVGRARKADVLCGVNAVVDDYLVEAQRFARAAPSTRCFVMAHPWNVLDVSAGALESIVRVASWDVVVEQLR